MTETNKCTKDTFVNRYHKSADLKTRKNKERGDMVKYNKEFKEQALLLSDEIGVKKAAEQLGISYYTIADWRKVRSRKAKEERIASDKTPFNERELAMQREIQELKKARFNCGN